MLDISLDSEAQATSEEFKVMILDELNRVNNYGSEAKLIWGTVAAEEKNEKSDRLLGAIAGEVIAPSEARNYFLTSEGLEPNDKAYKKFMESKAKQSQKIQVNNIDNSKKDKKEDFREPDL
jgi:hypothetical protein